MNADCNRDQFRAGVDHSSFTLACTPETEKVVLSQRPSHGRLIEGKTFSIIEQGQELVIGRKYYYTLTGQEDVRRRSAPETILLSIHKNNRVTQKEVQVL